MELLITLFGSFVLPFLALGLVVYWMRRVKVRTGRRWKWWEFALAVVGALILARIVYAVVAGIFL